MKRNGVALSVSESEVTTLAASRAAAFLRLEKLRAISSTDSVFDTLFASLSMSCAYLDKSTRVCTVIVARPTYSTSSSSACEKPRPGIEAPSQGALDELKLGTRALMMCGTVDPKSICVISNVPTNLGVPGALFILLTNFSFCSSCQRSSRNMSNSSLDPRAFIVAPAVPAPAERVPCACASRSADSSLYFFVSCVNFAKSSASTRMRSSARASASAPPLSARKRSTHVISATNHASFAGDDNANSHTVFIDRYTARSP